jgi:NADPH2:quinone reductase
MKAVLATPQGAQLHEIAEPVTAGAELNPDQLLVRVRAASLNRADLAALAAAQNTVLGMEWAGDVVQVGSNVQGFSVGDRVMCSGSGAFAQYAVTDWGRAARIPDQLTYRQGASLMLALQTMHNAVVTHGSVQATDTVLIHGAASGVGLMAAQIARQAGASLVMGTSRNAAHRQALQKAGFDLVLDPTDAAWKDHVAQATKNAGVNVIIDQVSGPQFNDLIDVAAVLARIVNVGRLGGAAGPFNFEAHALKRIRYTGVTFRTRSAQEIRELTGLMMRDLGPALAAGTLSMPLYEDFAMHQAQAAYDLMASNAHFGKITLAID